MSALPREPDDTSPEIEKMLVEGYRRMGPLGRLRRALDLSEAVRQLAVARIRRQYGPDLDEREERLRLAALVIDRQSMIRAFGWDPEREGY